MNLLGGKILNSWRDECAVFGTWNDPEAARMTYLGLYALQHRGQESAGIVSLNAEAHLCHKGVGLVGDVFQEEDLLKLHGKAAIGHVRYSTTGLNYLANVQPLTAQLHKGPVAIAHNGNIVNAHIVRDKLIQQGAIFQGTNDTESLLHLLARHSDENIIRSLKKSVLEYEGAYSLVVLTQDKLIAMRDPQGFRPLVLGYKKLENGEKAYSVASETCAFDLIGATYEREIEPGEIFWVDKDGTHSEMFAKSEVKSQCVFEHVYFSRPDSVVFSQSVYEARKNMGAALFKENPLDADIVVPVPDSGVPAAVGFAQASKIPFELGIIRNHYIGRTFIQPSQSIRSFGVKIKLNPQKEVLNGKRVIVIDDSLVRGTTSKKIISLVRQAGAKEVHFYVASPPTMGPCYYGVDTPKRQQLIAAEKNNEEICKYIGADSLTYLTVEGLMQSVNGSKNTYCAACFDGKYPTKIY
jgi:amidophosphoribosyltransferase